MKSKILLPKRKSPRLPEFDYSLEGGYFITIVTHNHFSIFGNVYAGEMCLNKVGLIAQECWQEIPKHFPDIVLDEFIIMPNHVHGILFINEQNVGARHASPAESSPYRGRHASPLQKPKMGTLSTIIGSYKSAVTSQINHRKISLGQSVWQRSFYDRVIRDESELDILRAYIHHNIAKWMENHA